MSIEIDPAFRDLIATAPVGQIRIRLRRDASSPDGYSFPSWFTTFHDEPVESRGTGR